MAEIISETPINIDINLRNPTGPGIFDGPICKSCPGRDICLLFRQVHCQGYYRKLYDD